jgi:hypothetical protein
LRGDNRTNQLASLHPCVLPTSLRKEDYDALWEKIKPVAPEFFKVWRDCGLADANGAPRPALEVWMKYLRMPLRGAATR